MSGDNHFSFVCPMFNASKTLSQCLASIVAQSYKNWRIILIDDVSSDEEVIDEIDIINTWKGILPLGDERIETIWNKEKRWEVANVLTGIYTCENEDIICRIDGDDWLTDTDALAILDSAYRTSGAEAIWSMHRWGFSDKNISGHMNADADPYKHPWVSSHLKTFRKRLINDVKDENFRGEDGEYVRRAGDQAIYLPILANTNKKGFIPRVLYHYSIDDVPETYQTPDAAFQRDEALFLRRRGYIK